MPTRMDSGRASPSNDVVYVPRDAADITLADPAEFAALDQPHSRRALPPSPAGPPAGAEQLPRSLGARDPGTAVEAVRLADRRVLEVTADLFNVLNFLDGDWGLVRQTQPDGLGNGVPLLELVGYDTPNGRGVYELVPVYRRQIDVEASRWRLQLGATLSF